MDMIRTIYKKAQQNPAKIIFPESDDKRICKAVEIIAAKGLAHPILLDSFPSIIKIPKSLQNKITIIGTDLSTRKKCCDLLVRLRKHKGMSKEQASKLCQDRLWLSMLLLQQQRADALIASAQYTTAQTMRAALKIIGSREKVTSCFLMLVKKKPYLFADPSVVIDPTAEELARIAIMVGNFAKKLGMHPKIAMLSFSTHNSAQHLFVDKIVQATKLVKKYDSSFVVDGEIQVDAAIVPSVAQIKCPDSPLKGCANVLIFPDINAGNIGYKLVERLGNAQAIGPIILGLNRQVNVLSRGCSVKDIVDLAAISSVQIGMWS
ncbi:MAG: phosphate acetyltransferase [Nanoarchaeota archaeon]